MKWKRVLAALITAALLLSLAACGNVEDTTPPETVENLFDQTVPTTLPQESGTASIGFDKKLRPPFQFEKTVSLESGGLALTGGFLTDECGNYLEYNGGEMQLSYWMNYVGTAVEYGLGVVLFLDGQPQAYKLTEDGEYSYMHIIYPESGVDKNQDLFFTPSAGETGDMLELYLTMYIFPGHSAYDPVGCNQQGMDAGAAGTRVLFKENPPAVQYPEMGDRLISWDITYQETPWSDINDWSTEQLQKNVEYRFSVDGMPLYLYRGYVPENGKLELKLEIWGNPDMEYGLVLFVDGQLVTTDESEYIFFGIEKGMTTIIEATIDMSVYDGECSVGYVLVPRNYRAVPGSQRGNGGYLASPVYRLFAWEPK